MYDKNVESLLQNNIYGSNLIYGTIEALRGRHGAKHTQERKRASKINVHWQYINFLSRKESSTGMTKLSRNICIYNCLKR